MPDANADDGTLRFARPGSGAGARRHALVLDDGYQTPVWVHPPTGPAREPVVYLHGIQSHPGWYGAAADALAEAGHPVVQVTRRGSGLNRQARGDAPSPGRLLDDVAAACRFAGGLKGGSQVHLVGVSWGGKLAAAFAAKRVDDAVQSLTLIAPGIVPRVDVPVGTKLAIAACLLCCPRRPFQIPLSDVELFTDNPQMQEYLRADELRLTHASARLLFASRRLDQVLRRLPRGTLGDVPTSLLLADRDRIIDNAATRREVERLSDGRCRVVELPGAHSLEFEPDPSAFFEALRASLQAR